MILLWDGSLGDALYDRKEKVEDNIEQRNFLFKPVNLVTSFREDRVLMNFTGKKSLLPKYNFMSKLPKSEMN